MLLATALALLITGCAQQTFTVQNKPAAVAPETITHHFSSFLELGRRLVSDAAKICGGAENVVETRTQPNIRKWIARFYYFRAFILRWKRVCIAHNNCMSCPSIWATLSTLLINILLGSFQLFCMVISLSGGEIIPFSSVCQSGEGCIIHAGGGGGFTHLTDRLLMYNRRRPAATSSRQSIISALASANSFVYFASGAATSRWRICMSVIAAFASFSSLAFLSRWAL